jgi:murein DD-endopeptidase MepM/ murein hydrolase activator NlpD
MAEYNARIAPFINEEFTVTSEWWEQPRNHRGLDISTGTGSPLYSMCTGQVLRSDYSDSYGWVIIMKDNNTKMGFLYAHLRDRPLKAVGEFVQVGELVGYEGTTGDSTGIHLHLEMQDLSLHDWIYRGAKDVYSNPAIFMGIPNIEGITAIYGGTPTPPHGGKRKSKFPFVLYAKKLRQKKIISLQNNKNIL